ncbi:ubiquitin carboxyl-terminal hydrolase 22-like [Chenopodium quinoa]|uniref:ubiquitin carboxyl-terminal hydrolase 22-like n=1 Tax=Chenopodium quinoa TaxID=63459 RepID=UPI000B795E9E|nr:ubiquitin carboxyl-terminal hydrolase 22-like [Chenopodium quinoa]
MYTKNLSFSIPKPCKHLSNLKLKHGLNCYTHLKNYLKTTLNAKNPIFFSHKDDAPRCSFCSGSNKGRFYICLICSTISCFSNSDSPNHTHLHSDSNNGHEIAVDLDRAELYCCVCCDQVYDPDFDRVFMSQNFEEIKNTQSKISTSTSSISSSNGCNGSSLRKVSLVELDLMKSKQLVVLRRDPRSKMVFPLGLRGLNNLGSTCFMNSVLQALLHAPPLRNYFLSDSRHRKSCKKRSSDQLCLPCDIDDLFTAVFSGERSPYSPAQFLHSWWLHSENHATYEQQDAHEFFISILDQIHEKESKNLKLNGDVRDCECIAHRVFSGLLRSDLSCTVCGTTSTTYDPFIDISLDLDSQTTHASSSDNMTTLSSCLGHFTRSEKLGSDQKLLCGNCQERHESLKQLSFRQLPLVLCLHIKRFEHSHVRKVSKKIDQYVQFPFSLDMSPYMSSSIVRSRHGNRMFALEDDEADVVTDYEIFAVVTHSGMLESGHYVTFLRLHNQWYKCDDAWILEVDEATVRASQCYMIFYLQKMLYHKTSDDLICSPISPRRDAFLPIAGCC